MNEATIGNLGDHRYVLYLMAFSVTGDPHVAGDLVQDMFVRAMQEVDQWRRRWSESIVAWFDKHLKNDAAWWGHPWPDDE